MIQTEEEVKQKKINLFKSLLEGLGGRHVFKKPLIYRETPHTPTQYIYNVSLKDEINDIYDALDTIIQQLKHDIYELGTDQESHY